MNIPIPEMQMHHSPAYREDFYQWTKYTVTLLREGRLNELDVLNVAEEIESMGNAQKHSLISHLAVLLMHLLKWKYQPDKRTTSWKTTIIVQRDEITDLLEDSPSLKHELEEKFNRAYQRARKMAANETGLALSVFPVESPFTFEEAMTEDWLPIGVSEISIKNVKEDDVDYEINGDNSSQHNY